MADTTHLFTGKAGEYAVASNFLIRNWNVAFPAVDVGADLLITDSRHTNARRVQVKTANAHEQERSGSYVAQFAVPLAQLAAAFTPELLYVFAVYRSETWADFVVAERDHLYREYELTQAETTSADTIALRLVFDDSTVTWKDHDLSRYRNNWPNADP